MLPLNTNLIPSSPNLLGRLIPIQLTRNLNRLIRKLDKPTRGRNTMRTDRLPPNLTGLFPAVSAQSNGGEDKGAVWDTREDMDAAVVAVVGGSVSGFGGRDFDVGVGLDVAAL